MEQMGVFMFPERTRGTPLRFYLSSASTSALALPVMTSAAQILNELHYCVSYRRRNYYICSNFLYHNNSHCEVI